MNEKRTSIFENGLIWFGAGVSLAEILTGTYFAPLGFGAGFKGKEIFRMAAGFPADQASGGY